VSDSRVQCHIGAVWCRYEHSSLSNERIAELVTESLAAVGLKGVEERLPSELSGGMKKRVALARAIISNDKPGQTEQEVPLSYGHHSE
jgi:ABC-type transporter Mla maintaining outer membrane lipid asymmetry ATPase subunit MlaF